MPGRNWSSDKSLSGKSNLFTLKPKCLLTSLQPAGPGTGQTFTLSRIDPSRPLPLGTDHLFPGWYKWNWLEQGLIDLRTYASWHSGPGGEEEPSSDFCQDLQQKGTSGRMRADVWQRDFRENTRSVHLHYIVFAKTACLINDSASFKVLGLTAPLWFIPFEISTLAQVCACRKTASLSVEFLHPSNSNEPTSLVIDSFSEAPKWCVSFSSTMIKGAVVLREARLERIHLVTCGVLPLCL